jgi:hypothetical protein
MHAPFFIDLSCSSSSPPPPPARAKSSATFYDGYDFFHNGLRHDFFHRLRGDFHRLRGDFLGRRVTHASSFLLLLRLGKFTSFCGFLFVFAGGGFVCGSQARLSRRRGQARLSFVFFGRGLVRLPKKVVERAPTTHASTEVAVRYTNSCP